MHCSVPTYFNCTEEYVQPPMEVTFECSYRDLNSMYKMLVNVPLEASREMRRQLLIKENNVQSKIVDDKIIVNREYNTEAVDDFRRKLNTDIGFPKPLDKIELGLIPQHYLNEYIAIVNDSNNPLGKETNLDSWSNMIIKCKEIADSEVKVEYNESFDKKKNFYPSNEDILNPNINPRLNVGELLNYYKYSTKIQRSLPPDWCFKSLYSEGFDELNTETNERFKIFDFPSLSIPSSMLNISKIYEKQKEISKNLTKCLKSSIVESKVLKSCVKNPTPSENLVTSPSVSNINDAPDTVQASKLTNDDYFKITKMFENKISLKYIVDEMQSLSISEVENENTSNRDPLYDTSLSMIFSASF